MVATKSAAAAPKAKAAHPTFVDMIKECIAQLPKEDTRHGASRPQIKKFLAATYKLDMSAASNTTNMSKAISTGADKGVFALPKGPSGRVKLAPKVKAADKENVKPVSATKKPAAAPAKKAAPAPAKKAAAPAKKAVAPAKKTPAAAKKAPAAPAKKTPAKKTTATKTKSSTTKAAAKPKTKAAAPKKAAPKKAAAKK